MLFYISLEFKKLSQAELISFSSTVYESMSAKNQYLDFKPLVDALKTKNADLTAAVANAQLGGSDRVSLKNKCLAVVTKHLEKLANQVEDLANDTENSSIITESGYKLRNTSKTDKPVLTEIKTPTNVSVVNVVDKPGAVKLTWKGVANALNYAIQHKKKDDTAWKNGNYNNNPEFVFNDLELGAQYDFQICSLGPNSLKSYWTAPVTVWISKSWVMCNKI